MACPLAEREFFRISGVKTPFELVSMSHTTGYKNARYVAATQWRLRCTTRTYCVLVSFLDKVNDFREQQPTVGEPFARDAKWPAVQAR